MVRGPAGGINALSFFEAPNRMNMILNRQDAMNARVCEFYRIAFPGDPGALAVDFILLEVLERP
jgi:hypothetical protein